MTANHKDNNADSTSTEYNVWVREESFGTWHVVFTGSESDAESVVFDYHAQRMRQGWADEPNFRPVVLQLTAPAPRTCEHCFDEDPPEDEPIVAYTFEYVSSGVTCVFDVHPSCAYEIAFLEGCDYTAVSL